METFFSERAIPLTKAKKNISHLYKQAEAGLEVLITIKNSGLSNVSLINSDILNALFDILVVPIMETRDENLGGLTIAIPYLPIYGEGETREEAVENLIDSVIEFREVYLENLDLYKCSLSAFNRAILLKLLRCGDNRKAIRATLNV